MHALRVFARTPWNLTVPLSWLSRRYSYNKVHTYFCWVPIITYILLRNVVPSTRTWYLALLDKVSPVDVVGIGIGNIHTLAARVIAVHMQRNSLHGTPAD